jgi:hypothetical protein
MVFQLETEASVEQWTSFQMNCLADPQNYRIEAFILIERYCLLLPQSPWAVTRVTSSMGHDAMWLRWSQELRVYLVSDLSREGEKVERHCALRVAKNSHLRTRSLWRRESSRVGKLECPTVACYRRSGNSWMLCNIKDRESEWVFRISD